MEAKESSRRRPLWVVAISGLCLLSAALLLGLQLLQLLGLAFPSRNFQDPIGSLARLGWTASWLVIALLSTISALLMLRRQQALWISAALFFLVAVDVLQRLLTKHLVALGINVRPLGISVSLLGVVIEVVGSIAILAYACGLYRHDRSS